MRVKLTKEQKIQVLNSTDIAGIMNDILLRENKIGRSKEHFWVVCLSNSNRILLIELICLGTQTKTVVDPTEIFSFALQKRAVKVIMVHNHPSGAIKPSKEDEEVTDRMFQVGRFLDVPVIDHLIVAEDGYYSFVDSGLLLKLSKSKKYVLKYKEEEERLKNLGMKAGVKIGVKKGVLIGKMIAAKGMKRVGVDIQIIVKATGLSEDQIQKL